MPKADAVIGRVSIRVLPDTSRFRKTLKAELRKVEKSLKVEIPVIPKLDTTRIKTQAKGLREELEGSLRGIDGKVGLDIDQVAKARVEREIEELRAKVGRVKARIEPELGRSGELSTSARLATLTRDRVVNVRVRLREAGLRGLGEFTKAMAGLRGFNELFGGIMRSLGRLDIIAPKIGALALGVAGLGLSALSAAGNLLSLGASLASIAPLALALPGLMIGAGIGVGVLVGAFKDFNAVFPDVKGKFSELQDIISSTFWERAQAPFRSLIDTTFPILERGFERVSAAAGGFFGALATDMRDMLSQRLDGWFDGVAGGFANLTKYTGAFTNILGVLGTLGTGLMPRLADAVGRTATKWSDWLSNAEKTGQLNEMVETAIQALKDLGRVVGNVAGIFAGLARAAQRAGGSTLKTLADNLERLHKVVDSKGFQDGLTKTFEVAFDAMERIRTKAAPGVMLFFSQLAKVIEDIGPKVGDTIGSLLDGLGRALGNPAIRKGIDDLFTGIRDAADLIAPALDKIAPAVGSIASLVGDFVRLVGDSVAQALGYVGPFIRDVAEGIRPLTTALNDPIRDIVDAVGPGLVTLGQNLRDLFQTAASKVTDFWAAAKPFAEAGLKDAAQGLADGIKSISDGLGKVSDESLKNWGEFFGQVIKLSGSNVGAILKSLGDQLGIIAMALGATGQNGGPIDSAGGGGFIGKFLEGSAKAQAAAIKLGGGIQVLYNYFQLLKDPISNAANAVYDFLDKVSLAGTGTKAYIKSFFEGLAGDFSTGWTIAQAITQNALDSMASTTAGIFAQISSTISGSWTFISSATASSLAIVQGHVSSVWSGIQSTVSGAMNGVTTFVTQGLIGIVGQFGSIPGRIRDALSRLGGTLRDLATGGIDNFVQGLATGLVSVIAFFTGLPGRILSAFGNGNSILVDAGRRVIDGFISGITSAFQRVKDALSSLTSLLPSWKGPPSTDSKILVNAGQLVIDGFIDGLESRYDAVRSTLGSLSRELGNTELAAPTVASIGMSAQLAAAGFADSRASVVNNQQKFIYNAAPGSSLGAEEDLFRALDRPRSRMPWGN